MRRGRSRLVFGRRIRRGHPLENLILTLYLLGLAIAFTAAAVGLWHGVQAVR